jgi:hypothetical protein
MKRTELSRARLETLTTEELIVLADQFDIEVPPDLAWNFMVETLLDINPVDNADDDLVDELSSGAFDDAAATETKRGDEPPQAADEADGDIDICEEIGPVPLPTHYNITFIDILIRDPLWVYVFWEIKTHDREIFEGSADFTNYFLKICPVEDAQKVFTISVHPEDTAWYVGIPEAGASYRIDLCVLVDGREIALASSRVFTTPVLFEPRTLNAAPPLHVLSGIRDFPILRNRERAVV